MGLGVRVRVTARARHHVCLDAASDAQARGRRYVANV